MVTCRRLSRDFSGVFPGGFSGVFPDCFSVIFSDEGAVDGLLGNVGSATFSPRQSLATQQLLENATIRGRDWYKFWPVLTSDVTV